MTLLLQPHRAGRSRLATLGLLLGLALLTGLPGCAAPIATFLWVVRGNPTPPEFDGLQEQRVIVYCRSSGQDHGTLRATRELSDLIGRNLRKHGKKIDVVPFSEVMARVDEFGVVDPVEIGQALEADFAVVVDVEDFTLFGGPNVYRGRSNIQIAVFEVETGERVWNRIPEETTFPRVRDVAISEMREARFRAEYVDYLAASIARHFHPYEKSETFAAP